MITHRKLTRMPAGADIVRTSILADMARPPGLPARVSGVFPRTGGSGFFLRG